jgi:L-cysteate sulfo-lyase
LDIPASVHPEEIINLSDYVGNGYGKATQAGIDAITLVAKKEGIILDPVYTGKAMAGLIDHIKKGKIRSQTNVVFIHTGGLPLIFEYSNVLGRPITVPPLRRE